MTKYLPAAAAVLTLAAGTMQHAVARPLNFGTNYGSYAGHSVLTGRSQVVTTGRLGTGMYSTTLPGGGQGILMDNGNGTSTLISPGAVQTVPNP